MYKDLEEAKNAILALIDSGKTYRDIATGAFNIGGAKRRFSIALISKWKREREGTSTAPGEEEQLGGEGRRAAKAYTMFREGKGPNDVVLSLEYPPSDAEKFFDSFKKNQGKNAPAKLAERHESRIKKLENVVNDVANEIWYSIFLHKPFCETENCEGQETNYLEISVKCAKCGRRQTKRITHPELVDSDKGRFEEWGSVIGTTKKF